jgi:hypothetical protein
MPTHVFDPKTRSTPTPNRTVLVALLGVLIGSLVVWMVRVYSHLPYRTIPRGYEQYIQENLELTGPNRWSVPRQSFEELGWFWQQRWWIQDFAVEAISRWDTLVLGLIFSFVGVAILNFSWREWFGISLLGHRPTIVVEVTVTHHYPPETANSLPDPSAGTDKETSE